MYNILIIYFTYLLSNDILFTWRMNVVRTDETDDRQYVVRKNSDNTYWSAEEKAQLVLMGSSKRVAITTLCRVNNIGPPLYYEWRELFIARGKEGLSGKGGSSQKEIDLETKIHALERYIGELILEKELLKKLKNA